MRQSTSSWIFRIAVVVILARLGWDAVNAFMAGRAPDVALFIALVVAFTIIPFLMIRFRLVGKKFDEQTWRFSEEGVSLQSAQVSSTYSWSHFTRAAADPWFYYLYYTTRACVFIPKRAFETQAQESVFRNLIPSHLKTRLK